MDRSKSPVALAALPSAKTSVNGIQAFIGNPLYRYECMIKATVILRPRAKGRQHSTVQP